MFHNCRVYVCDKQMMKHIMIPPPQSEANRRLTKLAVKNQVRFPLSL